MDVVNLKKLYKEAFPYDTEKYIDYFFSTKVNYEKIFTLVRSGELISALYLIDKRVSFNDQVVTVPYIVAAGTKLEYRGQKLLEDVMRDAFKYLETNNFPFVALYPFKHDYYKKYGFIVSDYSYKLNSCGKNNKYIFKETTDIDTMLEMYNQYFQGVNHIYRDKDVMNKRLHELAAEGGRAYLIYKDEQLLGYTLVSDEVDELVFFGDIFDLEKEQFFEGKKSDIFLNESTRNHDNSMIKICNLEQFLKLLKYQPDFEYDGIIKFEIKYLESKVFKINVKNRIISIISVKSEKYDDVICEEELAMQAFSLLSKNNQSKFISGIIPQKAFFVEKF